MCFGGGKASKAAAAAAEAEAMRQAGVEKDRLAQEAIDAKAEADRRAAAEQKRWDDMFAQSKAEAETLKEELRKQEAFRLSEAQKAEDARKEERAAELKRQDDERKKAEAAAAQKAQTLQTYATDRQKLMDGAYGQVNAAFAPYDDNFFEGYANQYVDYYKPQLDEQYDDARRATIFDNANRGTLDSKSSARAFGRLDQQRAGAEADIGQRARSAAMGLRANVDSQRSQLLNGVFGAINAAPPITGDNVGEANTSLNQISSALTNPLRMAGNFSVGTPTYDPLANPFRMPTGSRPVTRYGAGSTDTYGRSGNSSSGRLVA